MPSDPGELRIRNRRYRPWVEIAGVMWLVSLIFVIAFVQFVGRPEQIRAYSVLALLSFVVGYCLPAWVLVLAVTERPLPSRRETARAVWNWVFRRIRPNDPGRVGAAIVLHLFGWLAPRRTSVSFLILAEAIAFDPRYPVPAGEVRRVRFAPDPAEDYADLEGPVHYCAAAVELSTGKELCLILDEADADQLREWAAAKGIAVSDTDGYTPRPAGPVQEAAIHE
jgi:hypothetical protein